MFFLFAYYVDLPIMAIGGGNHLIYIYTLLAAAITSGAVMNYVIYRKTAVEGNVYSNVLSFAIPVFFGVDIYALTWGGFPYIVDSMLFVLLLFLLDKEVWKKADYIYATMLAIAIPLTHDLTWFVMAGSMIVIVLFNVLKKRKNMVVRSLLVLSVTAITGLIWWLPRLGFVIGVLTLNQSTGSGPFSPVGPGAQAVLLAIPYAIPILLLALLELLGSIKARKFEKVDSFSLVLITTAAGLVFLLKDPVVVARIILYSYTMLMVIVLKNLHMITPLYNSLKRRDILKKAARAALVIVVVAGIPSQFVIGAVSSDYYSSGGFVYDQQLISWAETHMQNGTVAAPEIGNYLASVSGNHVIIYSGFLVGQDQIAQRNAVLNLLFFPANLSTQHNVSNFNIKYVVISNSYLNATMDGRHINLDQSPFTFLAKFQYYSVYSVSYS